MRRWFFTILGITLLLGVWIPAAAVYYLAYTESGLQWFVRHIPQRIGRTDLRFEGASGTLARGFTLKLFELEHERVHIRAEEATGHIRLLPLAWQTVHAENVHVRNALVEVRRRTSPPATANPRFLPRWLIVRADEVRVDEGTFVATNGRRFDLTKVSASGVGRHRTLRFYEASFVQDAIQVSGKATLRADDPMQLEADARILMSFPNQPLWLITAEGRGDLDSLDLAAEFTSPLQASFVGQVQDLTTGWHWSGDATVRNFDLRAWGAGGALGRITGRLAVKGDAEGFEGRGPLNPEGLGVGTFDSVFEGSYADRVVMAKHFELTHSSSKAHVSGTGSIAIVPNGPRLDLRGRWREFRWPLVGEAAVRSARGEYVIRGTRPFDVKATGPLQAATFDATQVDMEGRLGTDRLEIVRADVQAFDGRAEVSGLLAWAPERHWSATGRVFGFNPARLRADLPGALDFSFAAGGEGFGADNDFEVEVHRLTGRLRGSAANGSGHIAREGDAWKLSGVNLALGRTRVSADGTVADTLDLSFALEADDLSLLAAESRGELRGRGTIRGTWEDPTIDADVRASGVEHKGVSLQRLDAKIDFDASGARPSNVAITAKELLYQGRSISDIRFTLDGRAANHVANLEAKATGLVANAELAGAFARGQWNGQLRELHLNGSESLRLNLATPVDVVLSKARASVEWFCLNGEPARLCADASWTPQAWGATVNASELPIRTLTSGLTPSVNYRGRLTVTARAFGGGGAPVQGNLRADLVDAALTHRLASGKTERITFGTGLVTLDADETSVNASVSLDAGQIGTIKGRLEGERITPRWQDMPIRGELNVQTAEVGVITLYAPDIDRVAGKLVTELKVAGTLGTPMLDGSLRLSDAELDLYQVNLAMRNAQLEARLQGNGLNFAGSARIGAGSVNTQGRLEWRDAKPYGAFALEGQNLRIVDVPEAQIDASPDLDFRIEGRRIEVTGAVLVPYAKIAPADLTNAVRASADEVLVGAEPVDPSKRFETHTGISLTLGDKVSLDTRGLTARLMGTLTLRSGTDQITRGSGELTVQEGRYTAYGRRLEIERGRLVFSGGPVNNPGVDIRAIKQYPDVKAGVNVRGTLLQPRLSFFSEPTLPQSQIVSLILAGGSIESAQNRNNPNQAGNELLAQGSAILAQQLGARVGLEDVAIESNLDNETSLVLGKYLSDRLYVSYGISFTEQLNTLKLRYTLSDRWTIRTEVGEARGADLVYTIDR